MDNQIDNYMKCCKHCHYFNGIGCDNHNFAVGWDIAAEQAAIEKDVDMRELDLVVIIKNPESFCCNRWE